jgi:hypothetical protein
MGDGRFNAEKCIVVAAEISSRNTHFEASTLQKIARKLLPSIDIIYR